MSGDTEANRVLNVDSLARGDSHMVARLLDTWNAARAERATWPLPWDDDYETREISTEDHRKATLLLGVLAGTWVRHLLAESGVKSGDLPPPTSKQQRALVRLLATHAESDDRGLTLLTTWARWLLTGKTDRVQHDFERLAGDMQIEILASVVNQVRATSPQYNGQSLALVIKPANEDIAKAFGVPPVVVGKRCQSCGALMTPPQMYPYGPDTPESTDCGGDCLACVRTVEAAGE